MVLHQYAGPFVWLFQGLLGSLRSELQAANPDAGYTPLNSEPPRGLLLSPTVTSVGMTHGAGPFSELTLAPTLGTWGFAQLSPVGACLDLGDT